MPTPGSVRTSNPRLFRPSFVRLVRCRRRPDDPARLVPIVSDADHFMIAVTGDLLRTNAYAFSHNGRLGFPTAKRIDLPRDWNAKLAAAF